MANQDKAQDAPVQIILAGGTNRVYSDGDVVAGTVRVDTRIKSEHASITFEGRSMSRIKRVTGGPGPGYQLCSGKSILFRYNEALFSGGDLSSLRSGEDPFVAFPFKFSFPRVVQGDVDRGTNLKPSSHFEHEPGHALPPTMNTVVCGSTQTVHYCLEARMPYTSHKVFNSEKMHVEFLRFIPSCADPTPTTSPDLNTHTDSVTRHTRRLDPAREHEHHGLRSHLKELFSSTSDPSATFAVTTRTPAAVSAGHALPVALSVVHRERSPELADPPPLRLHGVRVALEALTRTRVACAGWTTDELTALSDFDVPLAERHWDPEKHEGEAPPLLPADGEEVDVASLTKDGELVVQKATVPTFKTYALARTYVVEVMLWIECAGKVYEIKHSKYPINVLPWPDLRVEGSEAAPWIEQEDEKASPPAYEDVAPTS
ncbi:hypothetical protein UCRNP2_8117 [Neofusicoccum parvum UCRNP2]|uniref:Arrestin-like N-terminal domain-containing protein n=1 Tax=Botryosphaeria parva (strain UCR-NP2) TaxID=1287680 RepID=R1ECC6_BOTPV|nr:hypothetical protein UCRNP2_8117 [Neofusicoccum parvum UCRNP2]